MSTLSKTAIIIGANQGLGLALVTGLAQALASDDVVYLTAWDRARGDGARIAARMVSMDRPDDGIQSNAICPGLVDSAAPRPWFDDMSQAQSPDETARDIVRLALSGSKSGLPNGTLAHHRRVLPWVQRDVSTELAGKRRIVVQGSIPMGCACCRAC